MYAPKYFRNENIEEIAEFIRQNSFGIIVTQGEEKILATHIPLELEKNKEGNYFLTGHISRANPQWKSFSGGKQVLAIFSGPHTYISSSWYDHENVPTWNYIAAHVYGTIKIIEGEKLLNALRHLVDKYEEDSEHPVSVDDISEDYLRRHLKGIVGFEICIDEIEAVYKLSQNRDEKNHEEIIRQLEKRGDAQSVAIAHEMKNQNNCL